MNLFSMLLQHFLEQQTQSQSERIRGAGQRAAETGRRMATAGLFFTLATGFLFAAILMIAIELGTQFDRANGISFSGLMVSASILCGVTGFFGLLGWLAGRTGNSRIAAPPPPPPKSDLKSLLEEVAVTLLKQFLNSQKSGTSGSESETR